MMGHVSRRDVTLEELLGDERLQKRFHIEAYWLPELPHVGSAAARYDAARSSSRPFSGDGGHLVIASPDLTDEGGQMLVFSFPVEELYGIRILSAPGRTDALQILSVIPGTLVDGYRELMASTVGKVTTTTGFFKGEARTFLPRASR